MKPLAELIEIAERGGNLLSPPEPDCSACNDYGFVQTRDEAGVASVKPCGCKFRMTRAEQQRWLAASGMAKGEIGMAWRPWDSSHQPPPTFAREWLAWMMSGARPEDMPLGLTPDDRRPEEPWILTLFGLSGRGKSMAAAVLARVYIRDGGKSLVWANTTESYDRVQAERGEQHVSSWEQRILAAGLLVLDDYGRQHRAGETLSLTVGNWLYQRFRHQRPTVVSTNFTTFDAVKDSAIGSRLAAGVYREMQAETDYRDQR